MKNQITNYKEYIINYQEGIQKGIFFRCPIQKAQFTTFIDSDPRFSVYKYMDKIKNPIIRAFEILIGNRNIVNNVHEWMEDFDFCGFGAKIICCPIYFRRYIRKLNVISCGDTNIKEIKSFGFESEFEDCSGHCETEKTVFVLKNGKRIKLRQSGEYHYTYTHIIKEIIDSDWREIG